MLKVIGFRIWVWMGFCAFFRILFLLIHQGGFSFGESLSSFGYGARMDASILGYLLIITLVLGVWRIKPLDYLSKWIFGILLFAHGVIATIDIGLFGSWGHTINYQFFEYMKLPKEAMGNLSGLMVFISVLGILFILICVYYFAFKKHPKINSRGLKWFIKMPLYLLILGISVLLTRGGWQVSPINQSFAFFSNKSTLNYAAINSTWNFTFTLLNSQDDFDLETYQVLKPMLLDTQFESYFGTKRIPHPIASAAQPNVVVIMLESFTSNLVGFAGAENKCTPNLDRIAKEGLAFTHAYASGNRTDKGLAAVISGFPAQANASIITIPTKAKNLPSLARVFKSNGYQSTFYYGGEPEFANMKAYLLNAGIDHIHSGSDYPTGTFRGKWGVPDAFSLVQLAKDIKREQHPFFKILLTLSSHEPFDYPNNPDGTSDEKFAASMRYTDQCLGIFWDQVKTTPNTIFVFVADHGRAAGLGPLDKLPDVNRIPIVIAGTALTDSMKGVSYHHAINQHHFPSNLLGFIGMQGGEEKFLFQQCWLDTNSSIYLTYYNGVGLLKEGKTELYYNERKQYEEVSEGATADSLGYKARVYQQKVMQVFSKF